MKLRPLDTVKQSCGCIRENGTEQSSVIVDESLDNVRVARGQASNLASSLLPMSVSARSSCPFLHHFKRCTWVFFFIYLFFFEKEKELFLGTPILLGPAEIIFELPNTAVSVHVRASHLL